MRDHEPKPPKRMGRPPKPPAEVKRRGIAFRANDKLHRHIQEQAEANQRSIAEEVEYRLQIAADVAPILEAMTVDRPTQELFRTLARALKSVRNRSSINGLNEVETRAALKAAFDYIAGVNFWTGDTIPAASESYIGSTDGSSEDARKKDPAFIGHSTASNAMFWGSAWDECAVMDDYGDVITNYWSGDGKTTIDVSAPAKPPPARSLESIMAEINPRDRKRPHKKP